MKNIHSAQNVFITGATSGIGKIIACTLAFEGFRVTATARNQRKALELKSFFEQNYPGFRGGLDIVMCDFSRLASVVEAVNTFRAHNNRLDILINNAGAFNRKFRTTTDDIEETFQVNFLAPFLLTRLLSDLIDQSPDGRVIFTSSLLHWGKINLSDIEGRKFYFSFNAYRQSKLALILLARFLAKNNKDASTGYFSYHPGIVRTQLGHTSFRFLEFGLGMLGVSPERGAQTAIFLATAPREALKSGSYYVQNKAKRSWKKSYDMDTARQLCLVSGKYLGKYLLPVAETNTFAAERVCNESAVLRPE